MKEGVHKLSIIKWGTINPNSLKITGKPNRAMTPELKVSSIWTDRKNDYRRNKEKQKLRRYSEEYGNDGAFSYFSLILVADFPKAKKVSSRLPYQ